MRFEEYILNEINKPGWIAGEWVVRKHEDFNIFFATKGGFFKFNGQMVTQIRSTLRTRSLPAG